MYRSEQEPTWQMPLWTLVQDPHTDAQTKQHLKKKQQVKKKIKKIKKNNDTEYLKLVPT